MMKFGTLIWTVCLLMHRTTGQIIFPDEFQLMQNAYANSVQNSQSSFPTLPSNIENAGGFSQVQSGVVNYPTNNERVQSSFAPAGQITSLPAASFVTNSGQNRQPQVYDAEAEYWSNHVNNIIARGVGKFALDMDRAIYRSLGDTRSNVIFSPLSLVGTLAMVLLGSAGITFDQVAKILGLESGVDISAHSEIVHQMFGLLLESIDARTTSIGPQISTASGIFIQNGYPIRPEFMAISQRVYKNEVINLDFTGHPNQATRTINDWVKERTRGKISGILNQALDPETKLIIASALYFSGEWNTHFLVGATKRKPFKVTPDETVMVDMMYTGGEFPFYEDKQLGVKIVGLPYKGYDPAGNQGFAKKFQATMYVLLPTSQAADALSSLENRLNVDNLEEILSRMVNQSCILGLPKMKLSSTLNLNRALESLGLSSLFDARTSNLGLLSPGYNRTQIFTRFGDDDDDVNKDGGNNGGTIIDHPIKRNNYIRYEDKRAGYDVEQWDTGFIIKKIHRGRRKRRSSFVNDDDETKKMEIRRKEKIESYEISGKSSDNSKLRFIEAGNDKYKFERSRSKRQTRPIDHDFIRFIESRQNFAKFGLDTLRNSQNLDNPGLFASDVLHKVEIDVTETGTVGAAATTVVLQRSGDAKRLIANRPFLFFIRHEFSRLPLFWGTVHKPTPSY